jgi:hypothetical protein
LVQDISHQEYAGAHFTALKILQGDAFRFAFGQPFLDNLKYNVARVRISGGANFPEVLIDKALCVLSRWAICSRVEDRLKFP